MLITLMLYRPIYSGTDYDLLQMDIDKLCAQSDDNLLMFNGRKWLYLQKKTGTYQLPRESAEVCT